jgi:hypothetical protein
MPRRPNARPTLIYWLFDMRLQAIVQCPRGRPFYCGKTVFEPHVRLNQHRAAANKHRHRPVAKWINSCGDFVRIQVMESVPITADWVEREKHFIATLRFLYPGGANVTEGGQGTTGNIMSMETRAKIGLSKVGKKRKPFSIDHSARLSAALRGREISSEHRAKIAMSKIGKKRKPFSIEWRANLSAARVRQKENA